MTTAAAAAAAVVVVTIVCSGRVVVVVVVVVMGASLVGLRTADGSLAMYNRVACPGPGPGALRAPKQKSEI